MKIIITESQIQNIIKTNLVLEALPISLGKSYSSIERDEEIQNQIDNVWNELLKLPNIQTSKRKDRIYIPFTGSEEKKSTTDSPVKKEVEDYLSSKGYKLNDYMKGTVIEPKYNREVKIGKILDNPDLLKKFNLDDTRAGSRQVNSYIVISKHPYDIAGMSTDRGWDSCMNLDDGCNKRYVELDVKYGTLVAYFIKKNDLNIKKPIGRLLIKPYSNEQKDVLYNVSQVPYGSPPPGFKAQLVDIFKNINLNKKKSIYYSNLNLYNDDDLSEIFNFTFDAFRKLSNEERLQIVRNGYIPFEDGFATVKINDKFNLVNTNGDLVLSDWYDILNEFKDGFFRVMLTDETKKEKWNFINMENKPLLDEWVDEAYEFKGGFAIIKVKNKMNMINTKGEILSKKWYDYITNFKFDVAKVEKNKSWNIINKKGEILFDKWFNNIVIINSDVFIVNTIINRIEMFNLINLNGDILLDQWVDSITTDRWGHIILRHNRRYALINKKDNFVVKKWYNYIERFRDGFAKVIINNKYNLIDSEGNEISKIWFDHISDEHLGWWKVEIDNKENLINKNGELLSEKWFNEINFM